MDKTPTFRSAASIVLVLALVQFILQVSLLARGQAYIAASLMIDDTYYYLQSAWNTKLLGFVTFDGLHATNGVQLLWFLLVLLLALLAKTKIALLFATLLLTFLLNVFCFVFIFKIGSVLKRPALSLLMAALWSLQSLPFRIYSTGMENSLHALVIWCVVWQTTVWIIRVKNGLKPNFWSLTAILILNAWTRLDSALLSATVYAFCMAILAWTHRGEFRWLWRQYAKPIVGTILLAAAGLFIQLGAFWIMGGSILPVSALVKSGDASRGLSPEASDKLLEVLLLGMPSIVQGRFPPLVLLLGGLVLIAIVLRARIAGNETREFVALLDLWVCLLLAEILYHLIVAVSGVQYTPYFIWYRSPSFIFWIITAALAAYIVMNQSGLVGTIKRLNWAPVALSLVIFATGIYMFVRSLDFVSQLYVARYDAALWIAENSPPDAIYAAWNTGQLGYFSDRTFINLDGVINSVDYYRHILQGNDTLPDYLLENNVQYIVDYALYDATPELRIVRAFPIAGERGRSIQIWQIFPQMPTTQ